MASGREIRAELIAVAASIAVAALFFADGRKLKPGVFEPIGPGAVPMGVAVLTILLAVGVLIERLWRTRAQRTGATAPAPAESAPSPQEGRTTVERWQAMLGLSALTIAYVIAMQWGLAGYRIATIVYVAAAILIAAEHRVKALPWAIGLAAVFGPGLDYVFRHVLVTDLP